MPRAQSKSTRTKDGLAKLIIAQRKEIDEYMDSASYALEGTRGIKGLKAINLDVTRLNMKRETRKPPPPIRVNICDVYYRLSWDALCDASHASTRAMESITQGHRDESLKYCIRAERQIGNALAFAKVRAVEGEIAKGKTDYRHKPTKRVREQAIKMYRDKASPTLSAQKAADELFGLVRWDNGDDVTHRTLAEWIAAEKKTASSPK